jgi:DNA repair exonuclease SbcCD ATPase subunit
MRPTAIFTLLALACALNAAPQRMGSSRPTDDDIIIVYLYSDGKVLDTLIFPKKKSRADSRVDRIILRADSVIIKEKTPTRQWYSDRYDSILRQAEESFRKAEQLFKQADRYAKQAERIAKQAEQQAKRAEELMQRYQFSTPEQLSPPLPPKSLPPSLELDSDELDDPEIQKQLESLGTQLEAYTQHIEELQEKLRSTLLNNPRVRSRLIETLKKSLEQSSKALENLSTLPKSIEQLIEELNKTLLPKLEQLREQLDELDTQPKD